MKTPQESYCVDTGNMQAVSIKAVLTQDRENKRQNGRRFKEDGEEMFTITGQDIHGVAIDVYNKKLRDECPTLSDPCHNSIRMIDRMKIRRLTPKECERLQGFPDEWTEGVSDTQRYKQCGNAVTTKVIKSIMEQLIGGKFTQGATPSFNKDYQETSSEVSQIPNGTSDNPDIKLNSGGCLQYR